MKVICIFMSVFAVLLLFSSSYAQPKEINGYYPSWKWQDDRQRFDPLSLPYTKLTTITYAFFYPLESGEIVGMDPVADAYLLKGEMNSSWGTNRANHNLIDLAHQNGVKVILSIGGWDHSGHFPQVAADSLRRTNFARWCVQHLQNYGFDGIDVDWEFPGYKRHNGTPQDKYNFTRLLQAVRDSLNVLGQSNGKTYLLSASLPAAASHLEDMEVQKIAGILDYLNIMTYDLFGPWGKISNHNAALYGPALGDSTRCLDGAFILYHMQNQVPAEKINLGVPFYGHAYAGCTGIYSACLGPDTLIFPAGDGIYYSLIYKHLDMFQRYWDEKAQVPYLVSEAKKILVSFDDEESVGSKAEYVIQHQARGLIIWQLMGDYLEDGRTPLLDTIFNQFNTK